MLPVESIINAINVEIDGLRAVADAMRSELEKGFRSQVPQVSDAMQPGASIGAQITGDEWFHLQDALSTGMQGTLDAIYNLDKGTQAVAAAAEVIAKNYGSADALAKASADQVNELLVAPPPPPLSANPLMYGPFLPSADGSAR